MPNIKGFYPGLEMCGKNFTVKWMDSWGRARRQYTVCNVMRLDVYKTVCELLAPERYYDRKIREKVLQAKAQEMQNTSDNEEGVYPDNINTEGGATEEGSLSASERPVELTREQKLEKLNNLLTTEDRNQIDLIVKNYRHPPGVSIRFFVHLDYQTFLCKGPMGKGLNASGEGVHIAFAGGVGMLPFADLIAQLAYFNLGLRHLLGDEKTGMITENFKLIFFVSYRSRKEAVGIHLLAL